MKFNNKNKRVKLTPEFNEEGGCLSTFGPLAVLLRYLFVQNGQKPDKP